MIMKKYPVTLNFNYQEVIGYVEIDETKLPANDRWVLSLHIQIDKEDIDKEDRPYKLLSFGLVSEDDFIGYLKNEGRVAQ